MRTQLKNVKALLISAGVMLVVSGCSSSGKEVASGKDMSAVGPTVVNARAVPGTVELSRSLEPQQTPEILADVKDFKSKVTSVKLKFTHVPVQVPMKNIGGTTWRAVLTQEQLQMLAVSGKTMQYQANVIATNEYGQTTESQNPVNIKIKAPELADRPTS